MIDTSEVPQPDWLNDEKNDKTPRSATSWLGLVLAGVVGIGSFGIWVYAYSGFAGNDREYTDQLDAQTYQAKAEPICAAAKASLSTLPYSIDAADADERADQINDANVVLVTMVDGLRQIDLTGETERDSGMVSQWLDEYVIYVEDRERYVETLRVDPLAAITFTDLGTGLIERRLTWFADVNEMDSCTTPKDVG